MSKVYYKQLLEINIAMVLISTSGALGRFITISPFISIWVRSFLAAIIMILFCLVNKYSFKVTNIKDVRNILVSSLFLAVHWILYFYSLQLTNVAVALLTLFTYPLFTSILEPLIYKTKWSFVQLVSCIAVFLGLYVLLPSTDLKSDFSFGILVGLGSSLSYTIRNLILKPQVKKYNGSIIMTYQLIAVSVFLSPFMFNFSFVETREFLLPLTMLALVTTAMGHTLFLRSFKHFSMSVASILSSLQPVYGILIAFLFLHEIPESNSILGGSLIIGTVVYTGWTVKK